MQIYLFNTQLGLKVREFTNNVCQVRSIYDRCLHKKSLSHYIGHVEKASTRNYWRNYWKASEKKFCSFEKECNSMRIAMFMSTSDKFWKTH